MANINNSQLSKELIEGAKIQTSFDKIPTQLADKVVPVMEVNPKLLRRLNICKRNTSINATSGTIMTTDTNRETFITGVLLSVIKDATSTSTASRIVTTVDGVTTYLAEITGLTLTAQNQTIYVNFSVPLKVDKGATITVTNTSNVANCSSCGIIFGYNTDN